MSRSSVRNATVTTWLLLSTCAPVTWACCQLVGSMCGEPYAVNCNNGVVCLPGFISCPGATCTSTIIGQTCLATMSQPGTVLGLRVNKDSVNAGNLALDWDPSCSPYANDYSVHEGAVGVWYSHTSVRCSTGGALSVTLSPQYGNTYYLVAPIFGTWTGSFGSNSAGAQRPDSDAPCTSDRAITACP
jgi:hypothetical protein